MTYISIETRTEISCSELLEIHGLIRQLSKGASLPSLADFNGFIASDFVNFYTATIDARIVGMLTLVSFQIPTGLRSRIEDVVVAEGYRRQGVGKLLCTAAIDVYLDKSSRSLDLTSSPERVAANNLYQSLGFLHRNTNVYRYSGNK